eukprot:2718165-Pyramimonas_sp.AAC.1
MAASAARGAVNRRECRHGESAPARAMSLALGVVRQGLTADWKRHWQPSRGTLYFWHEGHLLDDVEAATTAACVVNGFGAL